MARGRVGQAFSRLRLLGLTTGLGLIAAAIFWFAAFGPNWLAPIARDALEASDIQARAAVAQVVLSGLTLIAAVAAVIFAKGSIDVAREAHAARLHLDLQVVSAIDDAITVSVQATNYGSSGCVIRSLTSAYIARAEVPAVLNGPPVSISLLPNERKEIGRVRHQSVVGSGEPILWLVVKFEGPFLRSGAFTTARFEFSPLGLINGMQFVRLSDPE